MGDIYIRYRKDIPEKLILECEERAEDGETYFIFDNEITDSINYSKMAKDKIRDSKIDRILDVDDNDYYISSEDGFKTLPSRFSFYDTETKSSDRYERYSILTDFIKKIGFEKSSSNLGLEMEQSFIIMNKFETWKLLVQPNMFVRLLHIEPGFSVGLYEGFFHKAKILQALSDSNEDFFKSLIRDLKLEVIGI